MNIEALKGIKPGKIISYELQKRHISQREFSKTHKIHFQTLNAIINGKRRLSIDLALKIERGLNFPEASLLILQTYSQIKDYYSKTKESYGHKIPNVRKILFWDTDFMNIDWYRQKEFVIRRIMQRGNDEEKKEIENFYKSFPK